MATQRGGTAAKRKASVSASDFPIPPIYVVADRSLKQDWESVVGWIAACVLVVFMLPILGMLYLDILDAKEQTKAQIEKVEKLRRQIERKQRDKEPSNISDNPVFDRVRRPLEIPLSKPSKLG